VTPSQFLSILKKQGAPPVCLLLGPEAYQRRRIRQTLSAGLPADSLAEHDLAATRLAEILDDARALSLFASERLIWVINGEAALPRGRAVSEDDTEAEGGAGDGALLAAYAKDPTPGVTLVFEASRFEFEGEDKRKIERVAKFYASVPTVVELERYAPAQARQEAQNLAARAGLRLEDGALDLLVEALAGDVARIATEIEKLSLYAGDKPVGERDIAQLVPDARAGNIFALVNAMGRRDRARALECLDALVREGEYLPLALSFLSSQFRTALVAREAGLKTAGQIQSHFSRMGIPMWGSRAEQAALTVGKFSQSQIEGAMESIYEADKGFRDTRPDDRVIMERLILKLVGGTTLTR
jgi:DNA polymerase-3 subunit delta